MAELTVTFRPKAIQGVQSGRAIASHIKPEQPVADMVDDMRDDYQVQMIDRIVRAYAQKIQVTVAAEQGEGEQVDNLTDRLTKLYWRYLNRMVEVFAYGRVAWEKVIAWDNDAKLTCVEKLNELPYRKTKMRLTPDGSFDGIEMEIKGEDQPLTLRPENSWWLAIDTTPMQPHGRSRYLGALRKETASKKRLRALLDKFHRKYAFGQGVAHGPMEFENPEDAENPIDAAAWFQQQADNLESGGFFYFSNKRATGSDGKPGPYEIDVERFDVDVRDGKPLIDAINSHDGWQMLAVGFPPKTVMNDSVGAFALVSMQILFVLSVIEEIVGQIVESFDAYVVRPSVEMNFTAGVKLATNFTPLSERPNDLASELVKAWLSMPQLNPLIASGAIDVLAILEAVGVAVTPDATEKLQRMVDAQAAIARAAQTPPQPQPNLPNPSNQLSTVDSSPPEVNQLRTVLSSDPVEMQSPFRLRTWR